LSKAKKRPDAPAKAKKATRTPVAPKKPALAKKTAPTLPKPNAPKVASAAASKPSALQKPQAIRQPVSAPPEQRRKAPAPQPVAPPPPPAPPAIDKQAEQAAKAERQLEQRQTEYYEKAVEYFNARKFSRALPLLEKAAEGPNAALRHRAHVYADICRRQTNEEKVELKTADDYYMV
jgi:hypothetical protein